MIQDANVLVFLIIGGNVPPNNQNEIQIDKWIQISRLRGHQWPMTAGV